MDIKKLQRTIVDALEDVKAQEIAVYNTVGITELFDRVVIATASSNRQTRALASRVGEKVKAAGGHVISTEGLDTGEWVLVDVGDAVVHIMQPAIRAYYKLEEIWGGKPVRMVLGGGRPALPEPEPEPEEAAAEAPAPAARKPAARKTAAKTPARSGAKTAARSAAKPAAKSAKSAKSARPAKSAGSAPRRAGAKTAKTAAKPRARKTAAKRAG